MQTWPQHTNPTRCCALSLQAFLRSSMLRVRGDQDTLRVHFPSYPLASSVDGFRQLSCRCSSVCWNPPWMLVSWRALLSLAGQASVACTLFVVPQTAQCASCSVYMCLHVAADMVMKEKTTFIDQGFCDIFQGLSVNLYGKCFTEVGGQPGKLVFSSAVYYANFCVRTTEAANDSACEPSVFSAVCLLPYW